MLFRSIDGTFENLSMGRKTHAEFRGAFEKQLEDFIQADMPVPDAGTLKRKYLTKLTPDLKKAVLNSLWPLDGEDQPARKPTTWEEVGDCCEMELQNRGDSLATPANRDADSLYTLGQPAVTGKGSGGGSVRCRHCQGEHFSELCASYAASLQVEIGRAHV